MIDPSEEAIRRGERAQAILADPLVVEAFAGIEADLLAAWRAAPTRDVEGRERIWAMLRGLDAARQAFEAHVSTGKVAAHEIALREADKAVNGP